MTATNQRSNFDEWYKVTYPRLVVSLIAAFGDPDLPYEAAAEAMAQTYEQWATVSEMESPDGWVYRVATNVARKKIRRKNIERRILFKSRSLPQVSGPAGEIWLLVADLPERQRLAVVLRHVGHLSESDVAQTMGITRGTVSATLRAAYRSLRTALDEPYPTTESAL